MLSRQFLFLLALFALLFLALERGDPVVTWQRLNLLLLCTGRISTSTDVAFLFVVFLSVVVLSPFKHFLYTQRLATWKVIVIIVITVAPAPLVATIATAHGERVGGGEPLCTWEI